MSPSIPRLAMVLVCLLLVPGCATTGGQRVAREDYSETEAPPGPGGVREELAGALKLAAQFERQGNLTEASEAYMGAARSARILGRLQDALEASQKAVNAAERTGRKDYLARALLLLGSVQVQLNAPAKALPVLERACRAAKEAGAAPLEATCHSWFSRAHRKLGQLETAEGHSRRAVQIFEAIIPRLWVDRARAGARGRQQLERLESHYVNALLESGTDQLRLRDWDRARDSLEKALNLGGRIQAPHLMARAYYGLGGVAGRQGDFATAAKHLETALELSRQPGLLIAIRASLGRVYRRLGRLDEAEAALQEAAAGIEDLRDLLQSEELRETFFEDKTAVYDALVLTLHELGKGPDAFDVSERARARAFLDLLGNRVTLSRAQSAPLLAEEQALRTRISALKALPEDTPALQRDLELAREAYQDFLQRVRALDREQASLMTVEPLRLPQVQALLPEGAVLLEYFMTEDGQTLLWTVTNGSAAVTAIPMGRRGMSREVHAFRELIASRGQEEETARMARLLFDVLVRPGLQDRRPTELILVPHDVLHYLPFQALMSAPGRYLVQEAPLSYFSSASLMQFTRAKARTGEATAFALGNPDLQDPTRNLRYADREARAVAGLFPGAVVVTGAEATESRARQESGRHRLLHFASHAELDETDPLGSALLLARDPTEDGRLEVQEIFGLDLSASLVVLSACETSLGDLRGGDELIGLTRAFIYAGAPSVITTLWQVNDRASYELMQEFYRNLTAGRDKAEALRQAQVATMQRYPHPYYWAAYQLTGEAR